LNKLGNEDLTCFPVDTNGLF